MNLNELFDAAATAEYESEGIVIYPDAIEKLLEAFFKAANE